MTLDADILFRIVDVTGVIANALLGAAVARTKGFDIIGFLILAIISGTGGGMMRDALLGTGFPVALTDPLYLSSAAVAAIIAHAFDLSGKRASAIWIGADALVLGCWSATGTAKALDAGLGILPAIFLGMLTAVGGAMLRDVIVNQVPSVFGGNPLYATISLLGSAEMVFLYRLGYPKIGMGLAMVTCFSLAIVARQRAWVLPTAAALTISLKFSRRANRRREVVQSALPAEPDLGDPPASSAPAI